LPEPVETSRLIATSRNFGAATRKRGASRPA
jgi:hypothetical protein